MGMWCFSCNIVLSNIFICTFFYIRLDLNGLFCEKFVGTHFHGYFSWGEKHQDLALADFKILENCRNKYHGAENCYWLVMTDGFYVSAYNKPFPDGWNKKKSW